MSDFGKIISLSPLSHEVVNFVVPLVNGIRGGVHRVDPFHEVDQYPCSKVPSESCICSGV